MTRRNSTPIRISASVPCLVSGLVSEEEAEGEQLMNAALELMQKLITGKHLTVTRGDVHDGPDGLPIRQCTVSITLWRGDAPDAIVISDN